MTLKKITHLAMMSPFLEIAIPLWPFLTYANDEPEINEE
jgi:hypothetical protein